MRRTFRWRKWDAARNSLLENRKTIRKFAAKPLQKEYRIYTDGGCLHNPGGKGGYGAVIIDIKNNLIERISGGFESTTNNRMEIYAVIAALQHVEKGSFVKIFSDSQYVTDTMTKNWKKNKNIDLWNKLDESMKGKEIEWHWVKGHSNVLYNEEADKLATGAMREDFLPADTGYKIL